MKWAIAHLPLPWLRPCMETSISCYNLEDSLAQKKKLKNDIERISDSSFFKFHHVSSFSIFLIGSEKEVYQTV